MGRSAESALDELAMVLEEAKAKVTLDPERNITLCAICGARAAPGSSWKIRAPGYPESACRRLCGECHRRKQ